MKTEQNMEADVSQDFQDYWNEYRIIQETKLLDDYLDEEYGSRDGMSLLFISHYSSCFFLIVETLSGCSVCIYICCKRKRT